MQAQNWTLPTTSKGRGRERGKEERERERGEGAGRKKERGDLPGFSAEMGENISSASLRGSVCILSRQLLAGIIECPALGHQILVELRCVHLVSCSRISKIRRRAGISLPQSHVIFMTDRWTSARAPGRRIWRQTLGRLLSACSPL